MWRWLALLVCSVCVAVVTMPWSVAAQDNDRVRVGVVIQSRGATSTYCVSLPASTATGLAALEATGVDLAAERGALGATVCRVNGLGCTPPAEACFCQCQGSVCNYWAYFHLSTDGRWMYSSSGVMQRTLKTGEVDGWLWNEGSRLTNGDVTPTAQLAAVRYADICRADLGSAATTRGESGIDNTTLIGYGVLVATVFGIGGLLIWRRRQRP